MSFQACMSLFSSVEYKIGYILKNVQTVAKYVFFFFFQVHQLLHSSSYHLCSTEEEKTHTDLERE